MIAIGSIIERYRVESRIGRGGMASVFLVRHLSLGSRHALKVLYLQDDHIRDRLVQEGQFQANLRHPNIVAVTDVVEADGAPGLVMEYLPGPTLEEWLVGHRPTLEEAESLFLALLAGVGHAHRLGVVHRDLKPANVLLEVTEDGVVPKITDFGLAKLLTNSDAAVRTAAGTPVGTPAYMAPEQIRDGCHADQRADIFALGCLLYELVCGARAFPQSGVPAIYQAVLTGDVIPPTQLRPDLPPRFERVILGALQTEREDRIPDCATMRRILLEDAPLERELPARWPRRRQLSALAAGIGFGLALVALAAVGAEVVAGTGPRWTPGRFAGPSPGDDPLALADEQTSEVPAEPGPPAEPANPGPPAPVEPVRPEPVAPRTGRVRFSGEALRAWLEGVPSLDRVPPGRWLVKADFPEVSGVEAGYVEVAAGQSITVYCSAGFLSCTVR